MLALCSLTHALTPLRPPVLPRHAPLSCSLFDDVLEEAKLVRGSALVEQPVLFDADQNGGPFDIERWNLHRSSSRYARLIPGILVGPTTRRIAGTVVGCTVFAACVGVYNAMATGDPSLGLPSLQLPLTPFELTAPVLGLLLVFRTDTANGRFDQGTSAVWEITSSVRSVIRKLVAWTGRETTTDAERSAALELIDGCLLLHGWVMGSYLRGKALKAAQEAQLFRFALGSSYRGGMTAGEAAMTPYLAITTLSLGVSRRLTSLTDQETVSIDEEFSKVTEALGKCEKLLRAPIPLGYTRYSVRFLWLWLSLLPFALAGTFAEFGVGTWWEDKPQPALAVAVLFVSFIFLSIEDIAVQIEEPFAILPLIKCHKWLLTDVRRTQALVRNLSCDPAAGTAAAAKSLANRQSESSS